MLNEVVIFVFSLQQVLYQAHVYLREIKTLWAGKESVKRSLCALVLKILDWCRFVAPLELEKRRWPLPWDMN